MAHRRSTTRGFTRTATVLSEQLRRAGESRGFAVSRVLTHWAEIAGPEIAAIAHARVHVQRRAEGHRLAV